MPYNSSAFEKQLAKYKAAQAVKAVADIPLKGDGHAVKSRVAAASGKVQPNTVTATQLTGDGAQVAPVLREDQRVDAEAAQTVIIIDKRRQPFYLRGWFLFLLFSVLSTAAMPIFFKDQMKQVFDMADNVKTTTGVDPFALKTYTGMINNNAAPPPGIEAVPGQPSQPAAAGAAISTEAVQAAQDKANAVVQQGPEKSMQYIQDEADRLNKMAKELDKQAGH